MSKNKNKTRRIVLKRFRITKTGKIKRRNAQISHLNRKDSASASYRKKRLKNVSKGFSKKIKKMMKN